MSSGNDEYDRKASEAFWKLPQELLQMMELQRLEDVRRLQMEVIKLKKTALEELGKLHFTRESPCWLQAEAMARTKFGSLRECDFVTLKWDPCKYQGAWKIMTDSWEGYVDTATVLKALGL